MREVQYGNVVVIVFILVLGIFGARFLFYLTDTTEYRRIESFIEHCKTPVQNDLADGLYRYQCDAGYYTSSLSPEKFQEIKDSK